MVLCAILIMFQDSGLQNALQITKSLNSDDESHAASILFTGRIMWFISLLLKHTHSPQYFVNTCDIQQPPDKPNVRYFAEDGCAKEVNTIVSEIIRKEFDGIWPYTIKLFPYNFAHYRINFLGATVLSEITNIWFVRWLLDITSIDEVLGGMSMF